MSNLCNLCKSKLNTLYLKKNVFDNYSVNVLKCNNCNHKFQENYDIEYNEEYYSYYSNLLNKTKDEVFNNENYSNYKKLFNFFDKHVRKYNLSKNILDVGAGYGELVYFANQNQWNSIGIELSKDAYKIANKFGVNIKNIPIEDEFFRKKKYSIIVLTEVIEHVDDPNNLILEISKLLEVNGILYITTPNFNSLDRYIMSSEWKVIHKEHINYFTTNTLRRLIKNNKSLELINIKSTNLVLELYKIKMIKIFNKSYKKDNLVSSNMVFRKKINNSFILSLIKKIINYFLNLFKIGNNFTIIIKKNNL